MSMQYGPEGHHQISSYKSRIEHQLLLYNGSIIKGKGDAIPT